MAGYTRRNVTSSQLCPICGKPDFCYWLLTDTKDLLVCGRETGAKDSVALGCDGERYVVVKPKTDGGRCVWAREQDVLREKQASYEAWCIEHGYKPKAKYTVQVLGDTVPVRRVVDTRPSDEELSEKIQSPERLDTVYRNFLDLLVLEDYDKESLDREWGRYSEMIRTKYSIKTMPYPDQVVYGLKAKVGRFRGLKNKSRKQIMSLLVSRIGEPVGVPGFYSFVTKEGEKVWRFTGMGGILFPVYDLKGRIIRLRVRDALPVSTGEYNGQKGEFHFNQYKLCWEFKRNGTNQKIVVCSPKEDISDIQMNTDFTPAGTKVKGKYKNFSSFQAKQDENGNWRNYYSQGTRSGSMLSIYTEDTDQKEVVYFTEGEKKAIVAHELFKAPVISFPGVGFYNLLTSLNAENFDAVLGEEDRTILEELKKRGAVIGVICYDADKSTNEMVFRHEQNAILSFMKGGLHMAIGDWNTGFGKGLDDIAIKGIRPTINYVKLDNSENI